MERRQRRRRLRVDLGARARARARAACCLLVIAASSGCDEAALAPRDAAPEAADAAAAELAAPPPGDGVVSRIATRAEVPLSPTWAGAREGDWMLRGGGVVAVVSTGKGRLVDFAFEGGDDGIYYVDAAAYDAFDRMHVEVARIEPVGEPARQLHVVLRVLDKPLDLHAWYALDGSTLRVESQLVSRGTAVLAVTLGETFAWGNTPTWVEGYGAITSGGGFGGAFVGRSSHGLSYAACADGGRFMARFSAPDLPGFHSSARTGEEVVTVPAGGSSPRRTLRIAAAQHGIGDAAMALPCVGAGKRHRVALGPGAPEGATLEVGRCLDPPLPALGLPAKAAGADGTTPDGAKSRSPKPDDSKPDDSKPNGAKSDVAKSNGAKLSGATPNGAKPAGVRPGGAHAAKPPSGDTTDGGEPALGGAPTTPRPLARFADVAGRTSLPLPEGCWVARLVAPGHTPGRWRPVEDLGEGWAAAGTLPAAGTLRWQIEVDGAPSPAKVLVRGVPPTPSPDWGDDAEGGAADNAVYSESGAGARPLPPGKYEIFVHRGPEHTLVRRPIEVKQGAETVVRATLERVVDTHGWISADLHVHAAPSFDAPVLLADRVRSLAAVDVQVAAATDHNEITDYGPTIRGMGLERQLASLIGTEVTTRDVRLGHFNAFPLAPGAARIPIDELPPSGLFAAMRAAGKPGEPAIVQVNHPRMGDIGYLELLRMDERDVAAWKARAPLADLGFDAMEVFNGDHYAEVPKVERAMRDWFALLEAGHRIVATGNSDTHKVTFQEAGVPRNWVAVPDDAPAAFDERAFTAAVRAGRVIVSSGPFVTLTVGGQPIGGSVPPGTVSVEIEVQAPPWIDVAHVELLRRGQVIRRWDGPFGAAPKRVREQLELEVASGDWLLVVVRGDEAMTPLHRSGARPFAFTNPVWVR